LEKERTNALEVAKETYEERKKEETKAKILDLSIYFNLSLMPYLKIEMIENFKFSIYFFIIYSQNIILLLSVILLDILSCINNTIDYTNNSNNT
jgi:hypothetical protein|tara:strand:+ start:190 stop:471 length:282 start_codon:yes stop_codon:yes gene_type:complete